MHLCLGHVPLVPGALREATDSLLLWLVGLGRFDTGISLEEERQTREREASSQTCGEVMSSQE